MGHPRVAAFVVSFSFFSIALGCGGAPPGARGDAAQQGDASSDGGVVKQPFPPNRTSGTRLRARAWMMSDGARVPGADGDGVWWDSVLKAPCVMEQYGNEQVCRPWSGYTFMSQVHADATCQSTELVAIARPRAMDESWSLLSRDALCGEKRYAYSGATELELAGTDLPAVYVMVASCEPRPVSARAVARQVPIAELAHAHVERVDVGHRLSPIHVVGDDGSRQRVGWFDNQLGLECRLDVDAAGRARCLPIATEEANLGFTVFADAGCTEPVVQVTASPEAQPTVDYLVERRDQGCGLPTRKTYYKIGARRIGDKYVGSPANCQKLDAETLPGGFNTFTKVGPETFDAFDPITVTAGQLTSTSYQDAEGAVEPAPFFDSVRPSIWVDTTTQQPCRFVPLAGGTYACVPAWSTQVPGLNCPRNVVQQEPPGCPDAPLPQLTASWSGDACTGGFVVSTFGAKIMKESGRVGDCYVAGPDSTTFYEIGAPAGPFPSATLVVE